MQQLLLQKKQDRLEAEEILGKWYKVLQKIWNGGTLTMRQDKELADCKKCVVGTAHGGNDDWSNGSVKYGGCRNCQKIGYNIFSIVTDLSEHSMESQRIIADFVDHMRETHL